MNEIQKELGWALRQVTNGYIEYQNGACKPLVPKKKVGLQP